MYRKVLAMLLVVCMVICLAPAAFAFEETAAIGDMSYRTLASAIEAAQDGDTITVTNDCVLSEGVTIPADLTVTLDLNGKVVRGVDSAATTSALITNNGNLTIKDSTAATDADGTYVSGKLTTEPVNPDTASIPGYASNTITNNGTLTVLSGIIENTATGGACYAIDNYAGSTANINGGKIVTAKTALRMYSWQGTGMKVSLNITDGTVESNAGYGLTTQLAAGDNFDLNISGGSISTSRTDYKLAVYVNPNGSIADSSINISGGTFGGEFAMKAIACTSMTADNVSISGGAFEGVSCYEAPAYAFISGGTFGTEPDAAYIAEGYEAVYDESADAYVVAPIAPVASIGSETYTSLQDAVKAAVNGDTIMILSDISLEETITIPADLTVTLDLNGYTVSMVRTEQITASHTMILNKGDLTITDSGEAGKLSYKFDATADRAWAYAVTTISNQQGSLTVLDGTIESLSTATNVYKFTIDSLTNGQGGTAMLEIKGGKITAAKGGPIRGFANSTTCPNIINISGGEMVGQVWMQDPNTKANLGMLNITGGTITSFMDNVDAVYFLGDGDASGFDIYIGGDVVVNGTTYLTSTNTTAPFRAKIENGTFNDAVYCCTWEDDENYTNIPAISGGAFKQEPEASNLQPGFIAVFDNSTDMYIIKTAFADVVAGSFYEQPAIWAASNGITNGTTATTFSPNAGCTRGQIVTFLWRACGEPKAENTTCNFTDVSSKAYYYDAMLWAVENGITNGTTATTFSPNKICSRAEAVTFIWRACEKPTPTSSNCPFKDVNRNAFYYKAMLFCVEYGITKGISSTTFCPDQDCTRAQIVTFLWRCDNA